MPSSSEREGERDTETEQESHTDVVNGVGAVGGLGERRLGLVGAQLRGCTFPSTGSLSLSLTFLRSHRGGGGEDGGGLCESNPPSLHSIPLRASSRENRNSWWGIIPFACHPFILFASCILHPKSHRSSLKLAFVAPSIPLVVGTFCQHYVSPALQSHWAVLVSLFSSENREVRIGGRRSRSSSSKREIKTRRRWGLHPLSSRVLFCGWPWGWFAHIPESSLRWQNLVTNLTTQIPFIHHMLLWSLLKGGRTAAQAKRPLQLLLCRCRGNKTPGFVCESMKGWKQGSRVCSATSTDCTCSSRMNRSIWNSST